jgi:tetratricopeptide (TPR) repeat protein
MTTLFEVLGVPPNATDEAVRTAFRRAAKASHPDLNLGDPAAEQQLRQIIAAYKALKTSEQRAAYNRYLAAEEQYWRNIGRKSKKERRFVQPAVAGLVTGSAVALAVWGSLSLSDRQERSEPQQTSRMAARITQPLIKQVDVTDDSSSRSERNGSDEMRVASATRPPDDPQHHQQSTGNLRSTADHAESPLPSAGEPEHARASAEATAISDFDERSSDASESGPRSKPTVLADAAQGAVLQAPGLGTTDLATERTAQPSAPPPELTVAKEESKAISGIEDHAEGKSPLKDFAFYLARGESWSREGDFDRAIADLDEAIRLRPDNALAYHHRGNAWSSKGELGRALADYEVAISLDPNNPALYRDRGVMLRRHGEPDRALVDFDHAVRLGFSDAGAYNERGLVWYGKQRYERAIADFNQALKINPNLTSALVNRGMAFRSKGDHDRALADFEQASIAPNLPAGEQNSALAQGDRSDLSQAVHEHGKKRELLPKGQR